MKTTENPPLVSVIIPTRNRRPILLRALAALQVQSYPNFEIIVVDDCSDDDTPAALAEFSNAHPQLRMSCLRNQPQIGANPGRNRGIRESRGAFVAFLDDDCIAAPDWLERLMTGFTSDRVAAVTGRIDDPPPTNIYELAFKGTHRIDGRQHAARLVAGNMCVRRPLIERFMLDEDRAAVSADTSVSGRGDEEGLFLMLRSAGYEVRVVPDAVVLHEHHYSRRSFFRQAYRGGRATARLAYKYRLPPRIELTPLLLAYLLLPLALLGGWWWLPPLLGASLFLAAISFNEFARKHKTVGEWIITLPVLLVYYHLRLAGYLTQIADLLTGRTRLNRYDPRDVATTRSTRESDKT